MAETGPPASADQDGDLQAFLRIAVAALEDCQHRGFHVSVVVVDAEGTPRVALRGDGAAPHTWESARRKAFTSASFGVPTAKLVVLAAQQPDVAGLAHLDNVLLVGGGVPLHSGKVLTGAIGVAGGTGPGQDEACARAGLGEGG